VARSAASRKRGDILPRLAFCANLLVLSREGRGRVTPLSMSAGGRTLFSAVRYSFRACCHMKHNRVTARSSLVSPRLLAWRGETGRESIEEAARRVGIPLLPYSNVLRLPTMLYLLLLATACLPLPPALHRTALLLPTTTGTTSFPLGTLLCAAGCRAGTVFPAGGAYLYSGGGLNGDVEGGGSCWPRVWLWHSCSGGLVTRFSLTPPACSSRMARRNAGVTHCALARGPHPWRAHRVTGGAVGAGSSRWRSSRLFLLATTGYIFFVGDLCIHLDGCGTFAWKQRTCFARAGGGWRFHNA